MKLNSILLVISPNLSASLVYAQDPVHYKKVRKPWLSAISTGDVQLGCINPKINPLNYRPFRWCLAAELTTSQSGAIEASSTLQLDDLTIGWVVF